MEIDWFIDMIKSHPAIWNADCQAYKEKPKRDMAWEAIARGAYNNFDEKGKHKKEEILRRLTAKWRNIRDTYVKSEKKRVRGCLKTRKYVYANKLSFLQPFLDLSGSKSRSIIKSEDESTNMDGSSADSAEVEDDQRMTEVEINQQASSTKYSASSTTQEQPQEQYRRESVISDYFSTPIEFQPIDDDKAFFDSLLPTVRTFTIDEKLEFRLEVLNISKRIRRNQQ
ncbi:uncharacterized protein LOC115880427 [Sitophilus oryzae]|uniref:Uncharacterized protein LOC115880427 n=1 Tax=Sitophilus oryzae TaxID=7048 RepID=A0A6J2XS90_SITOR|nr:uncharacterized protein LOC115880427 [Sitophilus oryzae]